LSKIRSISGHNLLSVLVQSRGHGFEGLLALRIGGLTKVSGRSANPRC
jgi:hypothetical protein